jgi:predicted AAA+ superfamily ATPase
VTYRLEPGNRERELKGILEAAGSMGLKEGYILTFNEEDGFVMEGVSVKVVPAWKWLLGITP